MKRWWPPVWSCHTGTGTGTGATLPAWYPSLKPSQVTVMRLLASLCSGLHTSMQIEQVVYSLALMLPGELVSNEELVVFLVLWWCQRCRCGDGAVRFLRAAY